MDLPKTSPAAILTQQNKELLVTEIKLPKHLETGQVLVELFYSGICGSQIGEISGVKGPDKWLPHLLGHEGVGRVLAIGDGITTVKPGDKIVAHWRPSAGIDAKPPKYYLDKTTINAGKVTTFNKFAVISENRLTKIPSDYDEKIATLFGCAITTAFGTIDNVAEVKLGDKVVVYGAGGVGLNLVQGAILAGASQVIAVDNFENRLLLAKSLGATHTLTGKKEEVIKRIDEITGKSLDIFIDNTGNTEIISIGYEIISKQGKLVLVGVPAHSSKITIHSLDMHFGKTVRGSHGGESNPHIDIDKYMSLLSQRKVDLSKVITKVAPLFRVNKLITDMKQGTSAGRCIIDLKLS